jgi:hypothetical protein
VERIADILPPYHTFDHGIDLKDGTDPAWGPIYALSQWTKSRGEYFDEMLRIG